MKKNILFVALFAITAMCFGQNDVARVDKVNGVYVFNDCTPLADYEVIGEIECSGYQDPTITTSHGQYTPVRDNMLRNAKRANYDTEGVILKLVNGGVDMATIIRFKNQEEDHSLARVNRYQGVYVFVDCSPVAEYQYLGNCNSTNDIFKTQYTPLRDKLINICTHKYKDANGIILHLISNGKDTAEAIKF